MVLVVLVFRCILWRRNIGKEERVVRIEGFEFFASVYIAGGAGGKVVFVYSLLFCRASGGAGVRIIFLFFVVN